MRRTHESETSRSGARLRATSFAFVAAFLAASASAQGTGSAPAQSAAPQARSSTAPVGATSPKPATEHTRKANAAFIKGLPVSDTSDLEDAARGLIAKLPGGQIKDRTGRVVWDLESYAFLEKEQAPDTVNPSLWRQARLNMNNGLFKVVDRVYQIRGFDLSNMTIIEGETGLILIDPLISPETAGAGLDLYFEHRPKKPVVAVVYTHSHVDHYGGVKGVVDPKDVQAGKVAILAPDRFLEEAISENVYAGTAMGRRGMFHTGSILPKGERAQVDDGLGKTGSLAASTLIPPTELIKRTGETRKIDGVSMEFLMAPSTEAPAEMLIYFPQFKVLDAAEVATQNQHNLYTLRGAQVRDARTWWRVLDEAINRYGDRTDVVIAQHHWPTWGGDRVRGFLMDQRDLYKFIHDQTLHLANQGYTPLEIAERLQLPSSLANKWHNRGYYGATNHNVKAVYQRYLGWYDGNPANLYPHPPTDAAKRYVAYMGGSAAAIARARQDFERGDYRWVAEVMNRVVFAEPTNKEARELAADALEQLGYQTESGTWRNNFLQAALELRSGVPRIAGPDAATSDVMQAMTPDMLLDYMGIGLDASKADGKSMRINWKQPDGGPTYAIELRNSVLIYTPNKTLPDASTTLTMKTADLAQATMGKTTLDQEVKAGRAAIEGDAAQLTQLLGMLDHFELMFPVVEP